jgi:phospholipid N-methyltransferase
MLLPLKTFCSATKVLRDGTSLIFIQYCKSETNKTLLNTGIGIPFNYWNKKLGRIAGNLPPAMKWINASLYIWEYKHDNFIQSIPIFLEGDINLTVSKDLYDSQKL